MHAVHVGGSLKYLDQTDQLAVSLTASQGQRWSRPLPPVPLRPSHDSDETRPASQPAFSVSGQTVWNLLLADTGQTADIAAFRRQLKESLFSSRF